MNNYNRERKTYEEMLSRTGPSDSIYLIILNQTRNGNGDNAFHHVRKGEELNKVKEKILKERKTIKHVYDLNKNFGEQHEKFYRELLPETASP